MRGLLSSCRSTTAVIRIIPARAGFTIPLPVAQIPKADHPRACGVYLTPQRLRTSFPGSSPRVRGLPSARWSRPDQAQDHPRACGVYNRGVEAHSWTFGSSPRVRGLHRIRIAFVAASGIIPARAGFTATAIGNALILQDHPRACGVYQYYRRRNPPGIGSSPRVRGLQRDSPCQRWRDMDHPRACGVYTWRSLESQRSWSLPPPGFLHC